MSNCHIESVAFGGEGIARLAGLVVFVPFTLPEEDVKCSIHEKKSRFARAHLIDILKKSPHRIPPLCPYFSLCGGCQLQHADYGLQLKLKQRFVSDALQRIGKLFHTVPDVYPSPLLFSYRKHISLKLVKQKENWQLCFSSKDGTPLVIHSCLLFHEQRDPIMATLQEICAQLDPKKSFEGRVKLFKDRGKYAMACHFSPPLDEKDKQDLKALFSPHLSALYFEEDDEDSLIFSCLGLHIRFSPFSFLQNHQEQSEYIYQLAVHLLRQGKKILDLYCGIGITSLLLAREGKEVIGVEINARAVKLATQNAKENNLNCVSFQLSTVESTIDKTLASFLPDSVLVNPPKGGLTRKVQETLASSPTIQQIVYISCHPPTLARDLAFLQEKGFFLDSIKPFDMFPQTTHVETVAFLKKQN